MKYTETNFSLTPQSAELTAPLLSYLLAEVGYDSFVTEADTLKAYIPTANYNAHAVQQILRHQLIAGKVEAWHSEEQPDINWNEEWEKHYYQPVVINDGELVVRASFHQPLPCQTELIIDPRMAFGTGNHATTLGMMQLLLAEPLQGKAVLDMGCGSGILGILAMKRGAQSCTSIDIDTWCVENALDNAQVNQVTLTVLQGTAHLLPSLPKVDILLANINRNIILQDLHSYVEQIRPAAEGGTLLLSGFLESDLPHLRTALSAEGYEVERTLQPSGEWVALKAVRSSK